MGTFNCFMACSTTLKKQSLKSLCFRLHFLKLEATNSRIRDVESEGETYGVSRKRRGTPKATTQIYDDSFCFVDVLNLSA
jgi:hypothetical protein